MSVTSSWTEVNPHAEQQPTPIPTGIRTDTYMERLLKLCGIDTPSVRTIAVYLADARVRRKDRLLFVKVERIVTDTGYKERTAHYALQILEACGILQVVGARGLGGRRRRDRSVVVTRRRMASFREVEAHLRLHPDWRDGCPELAGSSHQKPARTGHTRRPYGDRPF
jgi:hypothetical protein